jgi:hypothetical protein
MRSPKLFLLRNFASGASCFGEAYRYRLLAVRDFCIATPAMKLTTLHFAHGALCFFAYQLSVFVCHIAIVLPRCIHREVSFCIFMRRLECRRYIARMTVYTFLAGFFMLTFLLFLAAMVLTVIYELFFKPRI